MLNQIKSWYERNLFYNLHENITRETILLKKTLSMLNKIMMFNELKNLQSLKTRTHVFMWWIIIFIESIKVYKRHWIFFNRLSESFQRL